MTFYDFAARLCGGILRGISRFSVEGREHVPASGAYIVACNHMFALDSVYLAVALYPTPVHYMSKQENLDVPVLGALLKKVGVYGVNRQAPGPSFIKHTLGVLKRGGVVGIFPEGTRSSEGTAIKSGAVRIALKAGVPILPASYNGPTSWGAMWRRPKVTIRFGPPVHLEKGTGSDEEIEQQLEQVTQAMRSLRIRE